MPKHLNTADDFEMVAIERLKPHPNNVNEADTGAVIESIKAHGFYGALVVQRSTCHVVAGNHRLLAARTLGFSELPVTWITCDDEMAIRLMLTDNRSTRLGRDNPAALAELLAELAGTERGLVGLGFDGDDLDQLLTELAGMPQSGLLDDADPDAIPDDAPTRVKPGELWQLGNHRLLCGDSTKAEDVARLMGGEKADMVFTDPPYGVSWQNNAVKRFDVIANDDKVLCIAPIVYALMKDNTAAIVWTAQSVYPQWRQQFSDFYKSTIIWNKGGGGKGDLFGDFMPTYEMGLYCVKGRPLLKTSPRPSSVWSLQKDAAADYEHATQKPVGLPLIAFDALCDEGGLVVDLFLGSGTTLIAAEQTGRKCYGMELEPKYCDVILSRYEQATGKTAELIENG